MGGFFSTAASDIGSVLGSVIAAPFKGILQGSCQGVCPGTWDLACFIQHLCVSSMIKLVMVLGLCYSTMLVVYILFKLGIVQCVAATLCKMCWTVFAAYWCALARIICFFWRKLASVKRVNRRRNRRRNSDIESGHCFSSDDAERLGGRKRKFVRRRESLEFSRGTGGSIRGLKSGARSSRRIRIQRVHGHSHGRKKMKVKRRKLSP